MTRRLVGLAAMLGDRLVRRRWRYLSRRDKIMIPAMWVTSIGWMLVGGVAGRWLGAAMTLLVMTWCAVTLAELGTAQRQFEDEVADLLAGLPVGDDEQPDDGDGDGQAGRTA